MPWLPLISESAGLVLCCALPTLFSQDTSGAYIDHDSNLVQVEDQLDLCKLMRGGTVIELMSLAGKLICSRTLVKEDSWMM